MERLKLFVPHLERALRVSQQFGSASLLSGVLARSIDQEGTALIVLGASGDVRFASKSAENMARTSGWLRLGRSGLHLANPALDQKLQRALHDCRQTAEWHAGRVADDLEVAVGDGSYYRFSIAPLIFQDRPFGVDQPAAIVTIHRLSSAGIAARERLAALSSAELTLAQALAHGCTLAVFSRERGTSLNTVRAQLKSVFLKSGTHRQSELVRLVLESTSRASR
jgi:DNA-binding CsgD family transcriptional regulator